MLLTAWLVVVAIAVLATLGAVTTTDDGVAIVAGITGFITFGIAAFGAFDLTVIDGGTTTQIQEPTIAILMLALSILPGLIALTGPVQIISRVRETRMEEV